jgi:hypothetical protein
LNPSNVLDHLKDAGASNGSGLFRLQEKRGMDWICQWQAGRQGVAAMLGPRGAMYHAGARGFRASRGMHGVLGISEPVSGMDPARVPVTGFLPSEDVLVDQGP